MLFHVTMTHTPEDCPGYHPERVPAFLEAFENLEVVGKELNVKAHFIVNGAPDHVMFALLEADDAFTVGRYLTNIPLRQEFKTTAVVHQHEVAATLKQAMA